MRGFEEVATMTFGLFSSRHAEFSSASHRVPLPVPLRGQILKRVQDDILLGFRVCNQPPEDGLFIIRHADHTLLKFKKNRRRLENVSRQEYVQLSINRVFILQQFS